MDDKFHVINKYFVRKVSDKMDGIISYMDDICFNDINEFMQSIDKHRDSMLMADNKLLYSEIQVIDINNIRKLSDGRIRSFYMGFQFDCFFHKKESKYLYIILNGALTGKKPQFNRWSYYKFLDGSILDIADPMYEKYDGLELGWYYGNDEENLRIYISDYVKKIADYLKVKYENIIFWGSSGGGAAALECTNHIKGSIAVTINPQVMLQDYSYAPIFEKMTNNRLSMDKWHRTNGIYQLKQGKHILIMNLRSRGDMGQLKKICEEMSIEVKYGINVFADFIVWIYDCDLGDYVGPHNLQENYCVCFVIEWLVHHIDNIRESENLKSLFLFVNEFWSYRYRLELDWRSHRPNFGQIKKCFQNSKNITVWGGGDIGNKILQDILDVENSNYLNISFVIDKDNSMDGKTIHGIKIISDDRVREWDRLFIIIAIENGKYEVENFLKNKGLSYQVDYIFYNDLYSNVKVL